MAISSAEADYMALLEAAKETIYLRRFQSEVMGKLKTTKNQVFHERMKHIDMQHHFVRDSVGNGVLKIEYLPIEEMPADVLTKGLPMSKHEKCIKEIGLRY